MTTTITTSKTASAINSINSNPVTAADHFSTISYEKLVSGDAEELAAVYQASERDGFWYLDLQGQKGEPNPVVADVQTAFKIVAEFFALADEEKINYDIDQIGPWKLNGYTPFGRNAGLVGDGKKHGVEGYTFPRDNVCNIVEDGNFSLPPVLEKESVFLARFMNEFHTIGLHILRALDATASSSNGDGAAGASLASAHTASKPSTTCMMLQRYPTLSTESNRAGLAAHTDVGSLTILFCGDRGLQALDPATDTWHWLEPKPGCAVVNVGDSLRFLSRKRFRSALHRVVPYPGEVIPNRFSCAYFLRPELDAQFEDEEGNSWKSVDWHMRKYKGYRQMGKSE
ncbi:putative 2OG-Fe(II) oxygenase family oxidoreductase [Xylariomycetidae sp. FL2044]|nr:putative 2OG-Fe(II) oxygenase family oxidoreductase [Xylariomycetidae sp. FL2044]